MKYSSIFSLLALLFIACQQDQEESYRIIQQDGLKLLVQDSLLIPTKDGASISAIMVRDSAAKLPLSTILYHTIYAHPADDLERAIKIAKEGYVGIVSYSRGKGLSTDASIPYEHEADDTYEVIDWISRQKWSDGQVGMYGRGYAGFTQWAATKKMHPALKIIVPTAALAPGITEPMENGVMSNDSYAWAHQVAGNGYLDTTLQKDDQPWRDLSLSWYEKGVSYRAMDSLAGQKNPIFEKWLAHPTYDEYWQGMIPYQQEFAKIKIPVLTISGYYDEEQMGALHYLKEHYKYNPSAEHYLLIGPYTHSGTQAKPEEQVGGYSIGAAAQVDISALIFDWFAYVFKGESRPTLLQDLINYQVMGTNNWNYVASLTEVSTDTVRLYLSNTPSDFDGPFDRGNNGLVQHFSLDGINKKAAEPLLQEVDFMDRTEGAENSYYAPYVLSDTLVVGNGLSFVSRPFPREFEVNGSYFGELKVKINKKDFDFSTVLYEKTWDGRYFKLTLENVVRASQSEDPSKRQLLQPGVIDTISFDNVRMTSRKINRGSRLILVLNGNKHSLDQINYGTGKDVSIETIEAGKEPLQIEWFTDSYIKIPISRIRR